MGDLLAASFEDRGDLVQLMHGQRLPALPLRALHAFGRLAPTRVRLLSDFIAQEMQRLAAA